MREVKGYVGVSENQGSTYLYGPDGDIQRVDLKLFDSVEKALALHLPVAEIELIIAQDEEELAALEGDNFVAGVTDRGCWDLYGPRTSDSKWAHDGWSYMTMNGLTPFDDKAAAAEVARELIRQTGCRTYVFSWKLEYV